MKDGEREKLEAAQYDDPECALLAQRYEQVRSDSLVGGISKSRADVLRGEAKKIQARQNKLECELR
jgi:hypothetical protein